MKLIIKQNGIKVIQSNKSYRSQAFVRGGEITLSKKRLKLGKTRSKPLDRKILAGGNGIINKYIYKH